MHRTQIKYHHKHKNTYLRSYYNHTTQINKLNKARIHTHTRREKEREREREIERERERDEQPYLLYLKCA